MTFSILPAAGAEVPGAPRANTRITLLPLTERDLHALADANVPIGVAGRVLAGALPPPFVARRSLAQLAAGKPLRWCGTFLIIRNSDQSVVGGCGFKDIPHGNSVEIGYAVAPGCRQQGVATAAVRRLLRLAQTSGEVLEVHARIANANIASQRVVQKLDFAVGGAMLDEDGEQVTMWRHHLMRDADQEILIHRYLAAYNSFDIDGMLSLLADDIRFENYAQGQLTAQANGQAEFRRLAERAKAQFSAREQRLTMLAQDGGQVVAGIAWRGTVAANMPGGPVAGTVLEARGQSEFTFDGDRIRKIVDRS